MKFSEKAKWLIYYYMKHPKGRFELSHILELILFLTVCIILSEAVLYAWLNG